MDAIEARRLRPGEDHADATVQQITDLLGDLAATGQWRAGDPPPLVMLDAGYPATDISCALAGQPVQVLARLRSDRVFYADPGPRAPGQRGAPRRHGQRFALTDEATHHAPDVELAGESARYGKVRVRAWHGLHQALDRSGRWRDYPRDEQLPVVKGTVIQVTVERLPDGRKPPRDLWLWHCGPAEAGAGLVDLLWKAYLRRSGQEHFHRFCKVYLGLDAARLTSAEATGRWTALVLAAYTQLRLASVLIDDLRRPWHKKPGPGQILSPYRVRLGFRRLRAHLGTPARTAKSTRPGPGRAGPGDRRTGPGPGHRSTVKTTTRAIRTAKQSNKILKSQAKQSAGRAQLLAGQGEVTFAGIPGITLRLCLHTLSSCDDRLLLAARRFVRPRARRRACWTPATALSRFSSMRLSATTWRRSSQ